MQLLQRRNGHRDQLEIGALSDVEAPSAGLVGVAVVDEAREVFRAVAHDPVVLNRFTVAVFLGDIEVAQPEGAEQPWEPTVTTIGSSAATSSGIAPIDRLPSTTNRAPTSWARALTAARSINDPSVQCTCGTLTMLTRSSRPDKTASVQVWPDSRWTVSISAATARVAALQV